MQVWFVYKIIRSIKKIVLRIKDINMKKYSPRASVFELINAGKCNLNCTYCYIPKTSAMNAMHKDIVKYLDSGAFIEDMDKILGDKLEAITLWGTEPTIALDTFTNKLPDLLDRFPNLNHIGFSSNFISNTDSMVRLADALPNGREFELKIQYSIDGPPYITDETRGLKNATSIIINNLKRFFSDVSMLDLGDKKVRTNCKTTWDSPIIQLLGSDVSKLAGFFDFFNTLNGEILDILHNRDSGKPFCPRYDYGTDNISANLGGCITLGLPGHYTVDDGKKLANVFKEVRRLYWNERERFPNVLGGFNKYVMDMCTLLDHRETILERPETFTCAAGDSEYGMDHKGIVHGCHRTFYLNDDRYVKSVKCDSERQNWDKDSFESGKVDSVLKNITAHVDDEYNKTRFAYINGGFHYCNAHRHARIYSMVKLMALAGQASKVYLNDSIAKLFSYFITKTFCCPISDYVDHNNYRATSLGIIRVMANGAFEDILDEVSTFKADYECTHLRERNEELLKETQ